jgi:redox-sensitive bicupin YhaK (pirin superfamily)
MSGGDIIIRDDRRRQLLFLVLFLFFFSRNVRKVLISLEEKEDESLSTSSNDAKVVPMVIKKLERLNHGPMKTLDPFLLLVYHKDFYPPGDEEMGVKGDARGSGSDFVPDIPYRFYHGHRIPGFPRHPHRGFETITATLDGIIDHTDSIGDAGRYGKGDLQWMTAGSGIQHAEMFPLVNADEENPLRFFQIWLNLPSWKKMSEPEFVTHWKDDVKKIRKKGKEYEIVVWVGQFGDVKVNSNLSATPKNSWASDEANDVGVFYVEMYAEKSREEVRVPKARIESEANRYLYFVEGEEMMINGREKIQKRTGCELDASQSFTVKCTKLSQSQESIRDSDRSRSSSSSGKNKCAFLILQGRPIGEPIRSSGPMVMNTNEELRKAFQDFDRTQFGGWPWKSNDVVFPRAKERFMSVGGKEIFAPKSKR